MPVSPGPPHPGSAPAGPFLPAGKVRSSIFLIFPACYPAAHNGIVILTELQFAQNPQHTNPPGGIEKYYRENVIGGPGSFVMVAEDYNSFGRAMVKKLIAEIAGTPAQHRVASAPVRGATLASSGKMPR